MSDETLFTMELQTATIPPPPPPRVGLIDGSMSVEQIAAKVAEAIGALLHGAQVTHCADKSCAALLHFAVVCLGESIPRRFTVTRSTLLANAAPGMMAELLKWKLRIGAISRAEGVMP